MSRVACARAGGGAVFYTSRITISINIKLDNRMQRKFISGYFSLNKNSTCCIICFSLFQHKQSIFKKTSQINIIKTSLKKIPTCNELSQSIYKETSNR